MSTPGEQVMNRLAHMEQAINALQGLVASQTATIDTLRNQVERSMGGH